MSVFSTGAYSVVIVGAGISGIAAAHQLTLRGYNVTILESRSRIGGRIHTEYLEDGTPIELGCHFIHGPGGNPLTPLLEKFHIEFKPVHPSNSAIFDMKGKEVDLKLLSPFVKTYTEKMAALDKNRHSEVSKYKRLAADDPQALHVIKKMIHQDSVYAPNQNESLLSYKFGNATDYAGGNFLIVNGYNKLTEGLIAEAESTGKLEMKFNQVVTHINNNRDRVIVNTSEHSDYEADAIICTVPLGVLKKGFVTFDPPLTKQKQKALNHLGMAIHEKTILQFESAFWPDDVHYLNPYDQAAEIWREIINIHHFSNQKTAILVISNHADIEQLKKSDKEIIDSCLDMLKKIFGNKISKLKFSKVTRWYEDPFTMGSYSYHTKEGTLLDNQALAEPMDRIYFAGEHTSSFPSSVDGAYLSGIQAAEYIQEKFFSHKK